MRRAKSLRNTCPQKHGVRPVVKILALMLAGVWSASDPARAQGTPQTYWNGAKVAPDGVVQGGDGTWSANGLNWTDATGTVGGTYDPNGLLYFSGEGGNVTVDNSAGQVSLSGGVWFDSNDYVITGDALALTGDVSFNIVDSLSFSAYIRNDLTGSGSFRHVSGRRVVLSGNNTYAGGTTIMRGNVHLSGGSIYHPDADLGFAGDDFGRLTVASGGKLTTANGLVSGSVVVTDAGSKWFNNDTIYVDDGALTIENLGVVETPNDVFIAPSAAEGHLSLIDGGMLDLGDNDLYLGYEGVGTLIFGSYGRLKDAGVINAGRITTGSGSGFIQFYQADDITFSTPIQGNIFVDQGGYGSTTLTGTHSYANGTLVSSGTLRLDGATVYHPGADAVVATTTNNGVLKIDSGASLTSLNGRVADDPFGADGDVIVSGPGSSWTMMGDLSMGSETYRAEHTSRLFIEDGATVSNVDSFLREQSTVTIDGSDSLWSNTGTITFGRGRINIGAADLSGIAGTVTADRITGFGGEIRFNQTDDLTFSIPIDGSISLRQHGFGTTTLAGDSRVGSVFVGDGNLIIDGGRLEAGGSYVAGGSLRVQGGATLQTDDGNLSEGTAAATVSGMGSGWVTAGNMSIGANTGTGTLRIEDGGYVRNEGALAIVGSDPDGTGNVIVTGSGSDWTIENDLIIGYDERNETVAGPDGYFVSVENGGQGSLLVENGGKVSSNRAFIGHGSDNREDDHWVLSTNASGVVTVADNGSSLEVTGDIDLGHNGATGTLNIGRADLSGTAGTVSASQIITGFDPLDLPEDYDPWPFPYPAEPTAGTGTVNFNQTDDTTFSVPMHGNISVNQRGRGSTALLGNSTYTGATTVSDGTLRVNGSIASSAVTVQSGATLGGSGTAGDTIVQSGATIAPGNSVGTLTIDGDLVLSSGAVLDFELGTPGADASTAGLSDHIVVRGDLTLDSTLNILQSNDPSDGWAGFGYYRLMTYDGDLVSNTASLGSVPSLADPALFGLEVGGGRVDLFVSARGDDTLQHWQGGDGTWGSSDSQWLNQGATIAIDWAGNHAVFKDAGGHAGGNISVEGGQSFGGLEFVDNGYRLEGPGQLLVDPGGSEIRVLATVDADIETEISGDGGIAKTGDGRLRLLGANTYRGATIVNGGVLQAGSASAFGHNAAFVINTGTLDLGGFDHTVSSLSGSGGTLDLGGRSLVVDQSGNTIFDGVISGGGGLTKNGAGTLSLGGNNTYSGPTTVNSGVLRVNGSIENSAVTVLSGASLAGSGTVGSLSLSSGATLGPGNSIGRTTVAGDLTFAAGSVYEVETDPQSDASDQIDVSGVANIDGAVVQHIGESGTYKPFSRYNILTADGGVNGRFGSVTSVYAFLDPELDYDANNVYLELRRNSKSFSSKAVSLNQRNVADGLASLDRNNSVYQQVLTTEAHAIPATFDALSGDSLLAAVNAGYELQRNFSAQLRRRSAPLGDSALPRGSGERSAQNDTQGGANVWVQAGTSRLNEEVERGIGNAEYVMNGNAMALGVETSKEGWLMGIAGSAVSADLGFSNRPASGDMDAYFLGGYGHWLSETGGYVRGGLSYGWVNTNAKRTFNQRAIKSDFGMHGLRADVEAGVQIPWQQFNVVPYAQVSGAWLRRDGFQERGSSGAELSVDSTTLATHEVTLGVDVSAPFEAGGLDGVAWGGVAAVKRFDDTQAVQSAAFRAGSERFKVYSADMGDTRAELNLGVKMMSGRQFSFEASYFGHLGQAGTQHGGAVGLVYRW